MGRDRGMGRRVHRRTADHPMTALLLASTIAGVLVVIDLFTWGCVSLVALFRAIP